MSDIPLWKLVGTALGGILLGIGTIIAIKAHRAAGKIGDFYRKRDKK